MTTQMIQIEVIKESKAETTNFSNVTFRKRNTEKKKEDIYKLYA